MFAGLILIFFSFADLENHEAEMQDDYIRQLGDVKREHTKAGW